MQAGGLLLALLLYHAGLAQESRDSLAAKINPGKFAASVTEKTKKIGDKLDAKGRKLLGQLQQQEEAVYKKMLRGKDSLLAKAKLADIKANYEGLKAGLNGSALSKAKTYLPQLDSLNVSLRFLSENNISDKLGNALQQTQSLKEKFAQAEQITAFIKQRREQLKQQLVNLGLVKQLKQFNKKIYYYSAQVKEYKELLKDPKKIEKKALEMLGKTKLWQDFFKKNSMLASLFRLPGDPNDPAYLASLSGLQTRAQVNNIIQQQIQRAGPAGMQQFRQNLQSAQGQLNELKNRLGKYGSGSSEDIMPEGFKPNEQKTKSFLQRLEYGTNLQTVKASSFFPTTTDVGLSVGYKLNDKSVIGIGGSYKLGLGRGWDAIKFSSEGMGLRSYIDWKIKGSFWISGGYEMNYRTAFSNFDQLKDRNAWQRSGLLGLSKVIAVKTKFFKKTKAQLLWDFLSQQQVPRAQAVIFRINYNFK